ncbi:50S ribosomal protein L9 [Candidatus Parcubacteria bacterium]|nr:50S ribosomal protein L9 [Candidatus Parcubacteria bacterium]
MKVILKKQIDKFGKKGEIKDVKIGFASNYLIPEGLAVMATQEELKKLKIKDNN